MAGKNENPFAPCPLPREHVRLQVSHAVARPQIHPKLSRRPAQQAGGGLAAAATSPVRWAPRKRVMGAIVNRGDHGAAAGKPANQGGVDGPHLLLAEVAPRHTRLIGSYHHLDPCPIEQTNPLGHSWEQPKPADVAEVIHLTV